MTFRQAQGHPEHSEKGRRVTPSRESEMVLVTGGAGFIGSHLCDALIERGYKVICVDNFITGSRENIEHLLDDEKFELVEHDITVPFSSLIPTPSSLKCIFHLASPASPVDYSAFSIETLIVNSLGTYNVLEVAREGGAKVLLASTSEVYGDPKVSPQSEDYWGNVNPVGPRACYDEAKRFAEALTVAYHRRYGLDVVAARIFNSILADELVVVFNDQEFHLQEIGEYVDHLEQSRNIGGRRILVPSFDPSTYSMSLREVSAVIRHPFIKDAFEVSLRYGRKIKVTGDHSLFKRDGNGKPVAIPVRKLKVGDHVAIPAKLPVIERDFTRISISEELIKHCSEEELWGYAIFSPELESIVVERREEIHQILLKSGRFKAVKLRNAVVCASNKYKHGSFLSLYVMKKLGLSTPPDAKIRIYKGGAHIYTPDTIEITNDILWLIGFYLAEGCSNYTEGKNYFLSFSSDDYLLNKARGILEKNFGVNVIVNKAQSERAPSILIHSKILYFVFDKAFGVVRQKRMPSWVFQLPLARLKYVLEGFREGDGTHSGKKLGNELCFDTASRKLAVDLTLLLLRFGIAASVGEYTTTFKRKYGERRFPFHRVTVCGLSTFNILDWDKGVVQKLSARRIGDLIWAKVNGIRKCIATPYVYDFSVPGVENFVGGNGVCCHNTFGPRMRGKDGRVVPNFIQQALSNKPLTVYGDGSQTRSFCYIDDLIDGLLKAMFSKGTTGEIINLGNPNEMTILSLAEHIKEMCKSSSEMVFSPLPEDDPLQRRPDISRAERLLGWKPKISLDEGLTRTIEWFLKGKA